MTDSKGRQGGSTQINLVGLSDDATCLTGSVPSSVANPPSATASGTSSSSSSSSSISNPTNPVGGDSSRSAVSGGTIAGAVIGGLIGLVILTSLIVFFLKKRAHSGRFYDEGSYAYRPTRRKQPVDLAHETSDSMPAPLVHPYPFYNRSDSALNEEYTAPPASVASLMNGGSPYGSTMFPLTDGVSTISRPDSGVGGTPESVGFAHVRQNSAASSWQDQSTSSGARRKAGVAGMPSYQAPARFILHTDAEDAEPEEVVELPPQYSERRAPPGITKLAEEGGASTMPSTHVAATPVLSPPMSPPPGRQSNTTAARPEPSLGIFEQDDHGSIAGLQDPLSPGPPTPRP
ncbi:hypothetical protein AcV7_000717 [Taiwanofungus camphoratus]|nr:hypothetical protein AcW2_000801 [Antrodia cinnamomea]KAI0961676.1 hypothetical protein AcV7_000717 [Antrodia cinnamomea]